MRDLVAMDVFFLLGPGPARRCSHLPAWRPCHTLSGGEQQRVQFARALAQQAARRSIGEKQILFLDEPVSSLDLRHQLALLDAALALTRQGAARAA